MLSNKNDPSCHFERSEKSISNKKTWDRWELIAIYFLQKKGYKIIDSNYKISGGEVDIIANFNWKTIFIEVKYRKNLSHWIPEESLSQTKKKNILKVIKYYCLKNKIKEEGVAFEFIAITETATKAKINHFKDVEL